jgi:hypothetical protein
MIPGKRDREASPTVESCVAGWPYLSPPLRFCGWCYGWDASKGEPCSPHFWSVMPIGITHLYADDTMIMIQNSDLGLINLIFLLICYEVMSGMKLTTIRVTWSWWGLYRSSERKLFIANLETVVQKVGTRVEPWQGRFMSSAAWLNLIDPGLSNLLIYTMGLFLLADRTYAVLDKTQKLFLLGRTRQQLQISFDELVRNL